MVHPQGLTRDPGPFAAHLKCCTYFPFIPNFSWGALLKKNSVQVHLRLRSAAQQGLLLPLGLHETPERKQVMKKFGQKEFGRRAELLCPFFDTTSLGCSIWNERPGTCTTYFCKSNGGAEGLKFWRDVETYLSHFEWSLAKEIFFRLGLNEDEMEMCKATVTTEEAGEEQDYFFRAAWGKWFDKKDDFFMLALEQALRLNPAELNTLLGSEYLDLEENIRSRHPFST